MSARARQLALFDAAPAPVEAEPTLTEALGLLGYTHRATETSGVREVIDTAGRVVTRGRAHEVWQWLAEGRPEGSER